MSRFGEESLYPIRSYSGSIRARREACDQRFRVSEVLFGFYSGGVSPRAESPCGASAVAFGVHEAMLAEAGQNVPCGQVRKPQLLSELSA